MSTKKANTTTTVSETTPGATGATRTAKKAQATETYNRIMSDTVAKVKEQDKQTALNYIIVKAFIDEATATVNKDVELEKMTQKTVYKVLNNNYSTTSSGFYLDLINGYAQDKKAENFRNVVEIYDEATAEIEKLNESWSNVHDVTKIYRNNYNNCDIYKSCLDEELIIEEAINKEREDRDTARLVHTESYSDRKDLEQAASVGFVEFTNFDFSNVDLINWTVKKLASMEKITDTEGKPLDVSTKYYKCLYSYMCKCIRDCMNKLQAPNTLTKVSTKWVKYISKEEAEATGEKENNVKEQFENYCKRYRLTEHEAIERQVKDFQSCNDSRLYVTYDIVINGRKQSNGADTTHKNGLYKVCHYCTISQYTYIDSLVSEDIDIEKVFYRQMQNGLTMVDNTLINKSYDLENIYSQLKKCNLTATEQIFIDNLIHASTTYNKSKFKTSDFISYVWDIVQMVEGAEINAETRKKRLTRLRAKLKENFSGARQILSKIDEEEQQEINRAIEKLKADEKSKHHYFDIDDNYFKHTAYRANTKKCVEWTKSDEKIVDVQGDNRSKYSCKHSMLIQETIEKPIKVSNNGATKYKLVPVTRYFNVPYDTNIFDSNQKYEGFSKYYIESDSYTHRYTIIKINSVASSVPVISYKPISAEKKMIIEPIATTKPVTTTVPVTTKQNADGTISLKETSVQIKFDLTAYFENKHNK